MSKNTGTVQYRSNPNFPYTDNLNRFDTQLQMTKLGLKIKFL